MSITVSCKTCQASYTVKDALAGRVAECKHCGHKFQIPYRSKVVKLDEEAVVEPSAGGPGAVAEPTSSPASSFSMLAGHPIPTKKRKTADPEQPLIPLPSVVCEIWLPIGLTVVFLGISLFMALNYVLRSDGVVAGLILIVATMTLIAAAVIPLTQRSIESSALSFDFELSNSIYLQTVGALSLPIFAGMLGLVIAGVGGMIAGMIIGLPFGVVALLAMLQVSGGKGVQTGVLASILYVASMGGTILAIWLVATLILPIWGLLLPWQEKPVEVADVPAPAPAVTPAAPAVPAVAAVAVTPVATPAPAPVEPSAPEAPKEPAPAEPAIVEASVVPQPAPPAELAAATTQPAEAAAEEKPLTPADILAIARQPQWTVKVVKVHRADTRALMQELAEEKRNLTMARTTATQLRNDATQMESARVSDGKGGYKNKYSSSAIGQARSAATRAEAEVRRINGKVARLEREQDEAATTRTVTGMLANSVIVEIVTAGTAHSAVADSMKPDSTWVIDGAGRIEEGVIRVKPKAMQPEN